MLWNENEQKILTRLRFSSRLNLKYLRFVSLQGASRHAGRDVAELKVDKAELELEAEVEMVSSTKEVKNGKGSHVLRRRRIAPEAGKPEAEPEP